jgi:hypothetical protein
MPDAPNNNTMILENLVRKFKEDNLLENQSDSSVFEIFALAQITKKYDLSFDEIEDSIVDGGHDGGIDSIIILVDESYILSIEQVNEIKFKPGSSITIYISQAKNEASTKEGILDKLSNTLPFLMDLENDEATLLSRFNPYLVEKALILRAVWLESVNNGAKPKVIFAYLNKANTVIMGKAFVSKKDQFLRTALKCMSGTDPAFEVYGAETIIHCFQQVKENISILNFQQPPTQRYFGAGLTGFAYLGIVGLSSYKSFITNNNNNIVESLFEANVRHFQGDNEVNRKIKETVQRDFDRDFWWMNNGVTIIASEAEPHPQGLRLHNVQIVNGLQTSIIISEVLPPSTQDPRSILVKVIVTQDQDSIDKIISASNSQTQVTPNILRATEDIQRKIESFFLGKGFFYDRRKNFYKNMGKPSNKIFDIKSTAQVVHAIMNFDPATARSSPTKLMKDDEIYRKIFNAGIPFGVYLNGCLIFRTIKDYQFGLDQENKSLCKNFTYHLCRILASLITGKPKPKPSDLASITQEAIETADFAKSIAVLKEILKIYQIENPDENIINIAKSKKFSDEINGKIFSYLE